MPGRSITPPTFTRSKIRRTTWRRRSGFAKRPSKAKSRRSSISASCSTWAEAARWFRKAAEAGDAQAQLNLATLYDAGDGVPPDAKEASTWYLKAAQNGIASAQYAIGARYADGEGVQPDLIEAYKWVALAS